MRVPFGVVGAGLRLHARTKVGESLGPGDAHLVVFGVVDDERTALDGAQLEGRPRHAGADGRGGTDRCLAVAEQRQHAAQAAVEQRVGLPLVGEDQVRGERRVPVGADQVQRGFVVAAFGPEAGYRDGAVGGGKLLACRRARAQSGQGDQRERGT